MDVKHLEVSTDWMKWSKKKERLYLLWKDVFLEVHRCYPVLIDTIKRSNSKEQ